MCSSTLRCRSVCAFHTHASWTGQALLGAVQLKLVQSFMIQTELCLPSQSQWTCPASRRPLEGVREPQNAYPEQGSLLVCTHPCDRAHLSVFTSRRQGETATSNPGVHLVRCIEIKASLLTLSDDPSLARSIIS